MFPHWSDVVPTYNTGVCDVSDVCESADGGDVLLYCRKLAPKAATSGSAHTSVPDLSFLGTVASSNTIPSILMRYHLNISIVMVVVADDNFKMLEFDLCS